MKGELLSNDADAAAEFKVTLKMKLQRDNILYENLYSGDESGYNWRSLPSKTLASSIEQSASGRKDRKDRLTVLFCCNATGTNRMRLCVIGKPKKPQCFSTMNGLSVDYKSQSKAWMDRITFRDW